MFFLQLRAKPTKVMEKLHIAGIFNINFVLQTKWKNPFNTSKKFITFVIRFQVNRAKKVA